MFQTRYASKYTFHVLAQGCTTYVTWRFKNPQLKRANLPTVQASTADAPGTPDAAHSNCGRNSGARALGGWPNAGHDSLVRARTLVVIRF